MCNCTISRLYVTNTFSLFRPLFVTNAIYICPLFLFRKQSAVKCFVYKPIIKFCIRNVKNNIERIPSWNASM